MAPEISVIVPVYRAEAFLRKCAESVLNQTFRNLELILIDDGSPDGSGALCDAIAAEDARVRVFHKPNGGVSSARNLGMAEARGDYLAFADADDWLPENALELMYIAMEEAGADSAGGAHTMVWPDGSTVEEPGALPAGMYGAEEIQGGIVSRLLGERMGRQGEVLNGFIWRFLFTRSIVAERQITFAGAYLEDELFLMEYFCHAKKLAMVGESVYCYLQNPASVTRRYLPDYMDTFTRFMQAKRELAAAEGLEMPLWEENSNWSGLLIAIGNEYAPGNPAPLREKQRRVKEMCARPEMAQAIRAIAPKNIGRNKQMVADLVRGRHFTLLTVLYYLKNRGRGA